MKLKPLVLLGLLLTSGILSAQTDFRPGYIVRTAGDTIFGHIDYRGDLLMSNVCKFKNKEKVVKEYYPSDIAAFRFIDSRYFVSREINDNVVFMEYLIKGKVNIYYRRDENGDHYYLDKEGVNLTEIPYEEGTKYVDGEEVFYKSKKHIGLLNYYMQDAPELQPRIQSLKKPKHQSLIKLAEDYHNAICEEEKCIIYDKKTPIIKVRPELVGGVIKYSNIDDLNDEFYMQTGIIGHFWLPRTNEKMYFRTGVLFSQLNFDGEHENYYKIPLQLEYIYPKGIIRPRLAYGLNFYRPRYQTVSFDIGTNIKLSETFFLSLTSDIEFNSTLLILPRSLFANSFKFGLFINLE